MANGYEIAAGGLLHDVERAVHVTRGGRRDWLRQAAAVVALIYVPPVVIGVAMRLITGEWSRGITQIATHVRVLVTIPLLIAAEPFVDARARGFGDYLMSSGLVRAAEREYLDVVARSVRMRESVVIEAGTFVIAVASAFVSGTYMEGASSANMWGTLPSVIAFRFLLLRWVARWTLWGGFLWRVSRLPLSLRATHPDRMAGLGPALGPAYALAAVVTAISAAIVGGWADTIARTDRPLTSFIPPAVAFVVLALGVALAPGCVFIGKLYRARKAALGSYGALAQRYADAFDVRWRDARGEDALGTGDISGLCDLGGSYTVIPESRVLPWSPRLVQVIVAAAVVPVLPLLLAELGAVKVITQLAKTFL
jgi:hypothetical protein